MRSRLGASKGAWKNPGLTLGMTLEDDAYRAAVVATVAASIEAANR